MRKYIIYKAKASAENWGSRKLAHTNALTSILQENYDSSDRPLPKVGDRPWEFTKLHDDPQFKGTSTHHRRSNWQVVKVNTFKTQDDDADYGIVIICLCEWVPVEAKWIASDIPTVAPI